MISADLAAFNRGKLLNVGVIEALKIEPDINCFILHDVDTVPQYFRTIYKCHEDRRLALQMATYQKKRNYRYFLSKEQPNPNLFFLFYRQDFFISNARWRLIIIFFNWVIFT